MTSTDDREALAAHLSVEEFEDGFTWPEHADDDGYRGGGYVQIAPSDIQALRREAADRILILLQQRGFVRPSSPDGVIKERGGEDGRQELAAIREMLLEGQGDDDGSPILPDFQEGMTVHAMVAACVHLLERRRDALNGYTATNGEAPASTVQPPSSQESGVGEAPDATSRGEAPGRVTPDGFEIPDGFELIPTAALEWLNGEAPDHTGKWFGEVSGQNGAFWWRSRFRTMCAVLSAPRPSQREG